MAVWLCYFMISLQTSGRLMELGHKDGKLRVHYGDRLVTLMREVRQLSALGFVVPAKIQHTSNIASKFYRHGMVLKQVKYSVSYPECRGSFLLQAEVLLSRKELLFLSLHSRVEKNLCSQGI